MLAVCLVLFFCITLLNGNKYAVCNKKYISCLIKKGVTPHQANSTKLGSPKTTYIDGSCALDRVNYSLVIPANGQTQSDG